MVNTKGSCLLCIIWWTRRWMALWFNSNGNATGICWFFLSLWECWSASHCFPWDVVWGPLSCRMSLWVMPFRFQSDSKSMVSALRATCVCEVLSLVPTPKISAEKCLRRTSFQRSMTFVPFLSFCLQRSCNDCCKIRSFFPSPNYYFLYEVDSNIIANNGCTFTRQTHDFRKTWKGSQ